MENLIIETVDNIKYQGTKENLDKYFAELAKEERVLDFFRSTAEIGQIDYWESHCNIDRNLRTKYSIKLV